MGGPTVEWLESGNDGDIVGIAGLCTVVSGILRTRYNMCDELGDTERQ